MRFSVREGIAANSAVEILVVEDRSRRIGVGLLRSRPYEQDVELPLCVATAWTSPPPSSPPENSSFTIPFPEIIDISELPLVH
jgi:hypothetical protein